MDDRMVSLSAVARAMSDFDKDCAEIHQRPRPCPLLNDGPRYAIQCPAYQVANECALCYQYHLDTIVPTGG